LEQGMARITGVGGIFFKVADPKALAAWYRDVMGVDVEDWGGALFRTNAEGPPHLVWSPFRQDTDYFAPSTREFMINFAVDDLDAMIVALKGKGVEILGREDADPNGRFAWLLDPAGTKIELWEPKR
jgi:predicted enzyme related to lactoylglutathione lyase